MVFVIVEIERNDIQEIIQRLLGSRHRITVVEDLQTACGCQRHPKPLPKESREVKVESTELRTTNILAPISPCAVSSSKSLLVPLLAPGQSISVNAEEIPYEEIDDDDEHMDATPNTVLLDMIDNASSNYAAQQIKGLVQNRKIYEAQPRRNNGVPYNCTAAYPDLRRDPDSDLEDERGQYQDGVDMAIKCVLCSRIIALGTRTSNYSTRKYAHARSHGFKSRFECSICHALFKNKRVTYNHNRSVHGDDPDFRILDKWNENCQRELMQMVRKCFPKSTKPFPKKNPNTVQAMAVNNEEQLPQTDSLIIDTTLTTAMENKPLQITSS